MSLPLWSVATQTEDSGVGSSTVQINYSYFGLKADLTGRGLLGFRQINKTAPGADGTALTDSAQYLQTQPYIGVAASTQTTRVSDGLALKKTTNQYCDTTATNQTTFPCPLASLVQRPYLQQSVQTGSNLDRSPLPTVTTTNVINSTGDPTNVTVTTAASVAGVSETYTKTVANTYKPADTSGNNWILGRLSDTQVTNAVSPKPTGLIAASPGSAANASATSGTTTPLTAAASPASVTATATSQSGTVSGTTTLTIGGYPTPPLAYAFTRTSSSTNTQQITASGGPLVTFSANAANLVGQTATETFQISVTDAVGRAGSVNVTASLSGSAAVSVTSANFSPTTVTSGGTSTFSWSTLNATSASVSCTGAASGSGSGTSGSITVATSGAGTGTCTVTATNSANQSAQLSGTVSVVAAPSVASASFSPATVNSGATSTFSWNALNATSIAVGCVAPASGSYSGSSATGSITVSTSGTGTGSCTVTATNAAGTQATGSANLTVSPAFSVTFNPPSGSRTLSITNDLATPCGGESGDSVQFTVVGTGNLSASTSNSTYAVASPTSGTFSNTTSAVNFNTAFTGIGTYTWTATITVGTAHATYNGTTTVRKTSCGAPPQ